MPSPNPDHAAEVFAVPAAVLHNGDNIVELTSLAGAAALDVSLVDTVRLTYAHSYAADANAIVLSINQGSTRRVTGFTSNNIRVVDITRPGEVFEITQTVRVNSENDG